MSKYWAKRFKNILITGLPGSGKSLFSKEYAIYSGRYFLDFDSYIEAVTRDTVCQLYENLGEAGYRELEGKILHRLERKHNYVMGMGGATLASAERFEKGRRLGLVVLLNTPLDICAARVWADKQNPKARVRPLFAKAQSIEDVTQILKELWEERKEFYEKADVILDTVASSMDNLKMQMAFIEKRSGQRDYMRDVATILQGGLRSSEKSESRWSSGHCANEMSEVDNMVVEGAEVEK